MFKSFAATAVVPLSARSVTVVIAIPEEKAIPIAPERFAALPAGIFNVKNILAPAVGEELELWKTSFLIEEALLKMYHP